MRNANAQGREIQRWDYENIKNKKLYLTTIDKDEVDAAGNCFLIVNYKVGRALTSMFYLHEWPLSSFTPCFSLLLVNLLCCSSIFSLPICQLQALPLINQRVSISVVSRRWSLLVLLVLILTSKQLWQKKVLLWKILSKQRVSLVRRQLLPSQNVWRQR